MISGQRRQPARHVRGAGDRQQPRHRALVERGRDISGLEGAVLPALDVPAGRRARPGQQVGVMLGDRGDHDIAGAQLQLAGQVMDGSGRVLADDRDITRIWPAPGERQHGQAGALVSQDRRLGLVADAVVSAGIPGKERLDRVQAPGAARLSRSPRRTEDMAGPYRRRRAPAGHHRPGRRAGPYSSCRDRAGRRTPKRGSLVPYRLIARKNPGKRATAGRDGSLRAVTPADLAATRAFPP